MFRPTLLSSVLLFPALACTSADTDAPPTGSEGTYAGYAGSGGNFEPMPGAAMRCFYGPNDPVTPAATIEHVLEVVEGVDAVKVRLTLDPRFVDNTFGDGSMGWGNKGHDFSKLVGSDHAQLRMFDRSDELAVDLRLDYISADASALSGYASLGVSGGDGEVSTGDEALIVAARTSLDRNLNERGYSAFTEHSPATDEYYTPNPAAPNWDYRVVYEVCVSNDSFTTGFKTAEIEYIHASPAKNDDTIEVDPKPCPPGWGCNDPDGCEHDPNTPPECNDPDGCDNEPTTPDPDPECANDDECGPTEFCAEEGVCLPYVD
jgi:hypothetical protein